MKAEAGVRLSTLMLNRASFNKFKGNKNE